MIGFVVLPAALYSPIPLVERFRHAMRTVLTAQATASVISFFYVYLVVLDSVRPRGLVAKAAEVLVIVLLTIEAVTNREENQRGAGSAVVQLVIGLLVGVGLFLATIPLILYNAW